MVARLKKALKYFLSLFKKKETTSEVEDYKPLGLDKDFRFDEMWPTDPEWLKIAFGEIGQSEIKGPKHNLRILEYHQATSLKATEDEIPWCSAFVCWVLEMSNIRSTRRANAKSYIDWGFNIAKRRGAIVIFDRPPNPYNGHVGFYLDETDKFIYVLGGNQSNSVRISRYSKANLIGYRWPREHI